MKKSNYLRQLLIFLFPSPLSPASSSSYPVPPSSPLPFVPSPPGFAVDTAISSTGAPSSPYHRHRLLSSLGRISDCVMTSPGPLVEDHLDVRAAPAALRPAARALVAARVRIDDEARVVWWRGGARGGTSGRSGSVAACPSSVASEPRPSQLCCRVASWLRRAPDPNLPMFGPRRPPPLVPALPTRHPLSLFASSAVREAPRTPPRPRLPSAVFPSPSDGGVSKGVADSHALCWAEEGRQEAGARSSSST